ncbi:MAG: NfeD family protein [Vicinamibacterales bacterium]
MDWWMWLAGGLVLLVLELVTPSGFFVMFFGLGALATGVLTRVGAVPGAPLQWLAFTVISIASLLLFRGRLQQRVDSHEPGPPVDSLVGALALAVDALAPGKTGRGEVRGAQWTVRNDTTEPIAAGTRCRVTRVDGLELGLRPE